MSVDTDELRDLYVDVAGTETVTEPQAEDPPRTPIEGREAELEREVSAFAREDGLDDAIQGAEIE